MREWINKNYKTLIIGAFLVPIFTVALVSISHVTKWYGISNPLSWAIYLSIGIEIAALSTLAAISADMGKKVYFPFGIVTLIQFIGNIYFAYSYIDIDSKSFKDWIDLVSPIVEFMGVDNTDLVGHKRFLALFAGGMLPIISLSFLHMLVKFTEEDKKRKSILEPVVDIEKISRDAGIIEAEKEKIEKYTPTEEELKKIEDFIVKKQVNKETIRPVNDKPEIGDNTNLDYSSEPTPEEEEENFSTIEPQSNYDGEEFSTKTENMENVFQEKDNFDGFVPEPFATPEEVEKYNIDNLELTHQNTTEEEKKN